jgi:hydrogenase maturation protease
VKRIIGVGNLLLRDEGVGVHLIEYLREKSLPPDVELIDAAAGGFDLLEHIEGAERVVIVDAIKAEGEPGAVYKFTPADFQTDAVTTTSLHDVALKDIFHILELKKALPAITIFGVQPKEIALSAELSPVIAALLPRLADLAIEEISHA